MLFRSKVYGEPIRAFVEKRLALVASAVAVLIVGLVMLLNTWVVVWRVQKRLIAWTRASVEHGTPMPPEAERTVRWGFVASRVGFWLSFPMLFLMAAADHYPFLSSITD